ncbi:MAG: fructose-6-phosphate aldolase [Candidatus Micrarchaeota archaeon]|nr:fructose-6-phosphate aldolase [Candidatus Micrarchaeota archaeon]
MKIFADTENLDDLKEFKAWGILDGCTTNPLILAKAGITDMKGHMIKILKLVQGPTSIEVTTNDLKAMLAEAKEISGWNRKDQNIVVKLPLNPDGLKASTLLNREGVKTNMTACMNCNQAILGAKTGATYVSIFMGRIEDMGVDGAQVIRETRELLDLHKLNSKIIAGSLRSVGDYTRAEKAGAHVLTVPSAILRKIPLHPRTESTINEFITEYAKVKGKCKT